MNYIITECNCERGQIAVSDEPGEDCNLWERLHEIHTDNKKCPTCGKIPRVTIAYGEEKSCIEPI